MIKRRIRGVKKTIKCLDCNKLDTYYITTKDNLYQCKCCNEMYFVTEMDLIYGDLELIIKDGKCVNCSRSLDKCLVKYKGMLSCNDCNTKAKLVDEQRDTLLEFYDLFS